MSVSLTFRCPNDLLEVIDTLGRERYPADNKSGCDRSKTLMDIIQAGIQALSDGSASIPVSKTESKTKDTIEVEAIVENRLTVAMAVLQVQLEDFLQTQLEERIDEVQSQLEAQLESLRDRNECRSPLPYVTG